MKRPKAYVIRVPLLECSVTVLVADRPDYENAYEALKAAYKVANLKPKLADVDRAAIQENYSDRDTGLCIHKGAFGGRVLVWVYELRTGVLVHEISHATDAILESTGIGDNGEMRAILNEYLAREAVNGIRTVR